MRKLRKSELKCLAMADKLSKENYISISGDGVCIQLEQFLKAFKYFDETTRDSEKFPFEFYTEHEGTKFYCLVSLEERNEI